MRRVLTASGECYWFGPLAALRGPAIMLARRLTRNFSNKLAKSSWATSSSFARTFEISKAMHTALPLSSKSQTYVSKFRVGSCPDGRALLLYGEKPITIPGTDAPMTAPSEAVGELALAEWAGAFGNSLKKSAPIVMVQLEATWLLIFP